MTTTQLFSGLSGDKSSSRVLRPPGGGSSNIFGAAEVTAPTPPKKVTDTPQPAVPAEDTKASTPQTVAAAKPVTNTPTASGDTARITPTAQKSTERYNPITGERIAVEKQTPSTRVHQPPGGPTTKLW